LPDCPLNGGYCKQTKKTGIYLPGVFEGGVKEGHVSDSHFIPYREAMEIGSWYVGKVTVSQN